MQPLQNCTRFMLKNVTYIKKIVLLLLLLQPLFLFAGGDVKVKGRKFILLPFVGGIWQKAPFGELAIGHPFIHFINRSIGEKSWHSTSSHSGGYILTYAKLGAEFDFNFKHELWAPKAIIEVDYRFLCIRASAEDYLSSGNNNFFITPEAGFNLSGLISLTGGYNKPISHTLEAIPPYRISLCLVLPVTISGKAKKQK
jgi:hypothetical protein